MKVIIAGGRDFKDYNKLKQVCDYHLQNTTDIEIVSGTANGADKLGERYGVDHNYTVKRFPADWDGNGKSAGYIRNKQMAEYADYLIAFWDGVSKGTGHMIDLAKSNELEIRTFYYYK